MSIHLLAFDLDGTLLLPDKKVAQSSKEAIERAIDQGMHVAIASGRDKNGCQFVLDQLDLENNGENYLALVNGQIIYDITNQEYDLDSVLSPEDGLKIEEIIRKYDIEGIFCCGYDFYSYMSDEARKKRHERALKNGESEDYGLKTASEKRNFIELNTEPFVFTQDINKVCFPNEPEWFIEHLDELREDLKDYDVLMVGPGWMELMPKGIGKASALRKIAEKIGCTMTEVMAFGDAENDITMLKQAGIGVAMGNAMDTVKAVANIVTDNNLSGGIGKAITALLDGHEEELRNGTFPLQKQEPDDVSAEAAL